MLISKELTTHLYSAVEAFVKHTDRAVIAFSGGVDSSILAKICKDLGKQVYLVTIGFSGSHDILFSKSISKLLGLFSNHVVYEILQDDFNDSISKVKSSLKCNNLSHVENCIAFYQISKIVRDNKLGNSFLTANGFDELFCGYDRYRSYYPNGTDFLLSYMEEKLGNETHMMKEISMEISKLGIQSFQPFLTESFIRFAKDIPLEYKIKGPDDTLRKHILREIALTIGVPSESALHPKKAIQYGSLIHKNLIKNRDRLP
ncbi:MAG: asparagine synthase C-terminal domain-containing protein [Thermoproteota archaeon]|nr:asparagine synthase C-terminal domain-containing protein [Thermoproteota archaeon]